MQREQREELVDRGLSYLKVDRMKLTVREANRLLSLLRLIALTQTDIARARACTDTEERQSAILEQDRKIKAVREEFLAAVASVGSEEPQAVKHAKSLLRQVPDDLLADSTAPLVARPRSRIKAETAARPGDQLACARRESLVAVPTATSSCRLPLLRIGI
jgi:hypothetical protein